MKITLPAEPVDGYEIRWFSVEGPYTRICENRLLYHVSRTWEEVYPNNGRGADFRDEWQIFERGHFTGRLEGWETPDLNPYWPQQFERGYATRAGAVVEARRLVEARIVSLLSEAAELNTRLNFGDLA